ncbi:MAG: hypothetical protein JKY96_07600 [Phycisphaerales bacterium]|nr:hypothetical protein [Phycisphaerales bacterium]
MTEIRNELYGIDQPEDSSVDQDKDADPAGTGLGLPTGGIEIPDPTTAPSGRPKQIDLDSEDEAQLEDFDTMKLSPELLSILRGEAAPVDRFIGRDVSSSDIYAEHIRLGERLIAKERYFDAEERFTRALAIRPGDITAQIGRIHAQIGAGMVLSGSVNLQSILTDSPHLAGTRYSLNLLPSPTRTKILIEGLRLRAGVVKVNDHELHDDRRIRVSSGLLLAYIGFQTLNAEAVDDGLGVMKESGTQADQRLARLLEQIWDVSLELLDEASSSGVNPEK